MRPTSTLQSSFDLTRARSRFNFGRFGSGIYTSATSSKVRAKLQVVRLTQLCLQADSYAKQIAVHSPYSAMLLNEVAMGKEKLLTITDQALTEVTSFTSQLPLLMNNFRPQKDTTLFVVSPAVSSTMMNA